MFRGLSAVYMGQVDDFHIWRRVSRSTSMEWAVLPLSEHSTLFVEQLVPRILLIFHSEDQVLEYLLRHGVSCDHLLSLRFSESVPRTAYELSTCRDLLTLHRTFGSDMSLDDLNKFHEKFHLHVE